MPFSFENIHFNLTHSLFIGQSGSGKSFCFNWIINKILRKSPKSKVTIIDVGGSYKNLANQYKHISNYHEIEFNDKYSINIFLLKKKFGIIT